MTSPSKFRTTPRLSARRNNLSITVNQLVRLNQLPLLTAPLRMMSQPRHSRRYYDDSDDMIERVRRAREAFDKKANAFQGPDWPYYDKRIIVGKKKKPGSGSEDSGASQTSESQNSASTLPVEPDKAKE